MSTKPIVIDLLRHGPIDGEPALYGSTDVALAPHAKAKMESQLKSNPVDYSQVFCSPKRRCRAFAETLSAKSKFHAVVDERCREYDFGELDGIPFESMNQQQRQQMSLFWHHSVKLQLPGAECYQGFEARISAFWHDLTQSALNHGDTLVVTHGGVITTLVAQLMQLPLKVAFERIKISHASLTRISFYDNPQQAQFQFIGVPAP